MISPTNQLPPHYMPCEFDIVIGKGKKFFHHKGNSMLRSLAQSLLTKYSLAETKLNKSRIISDVIDHIRLNGNFVKRNSKSGEWIVAEDLLSREKTSAVFRDAMHQRSRSESTSGLMAKKAISGAITEQQVTALPPMISSLDSSILNQVLVPMPPLSHPSGPFQSENFTLDWPSIMGRQQQSIQSAGTPAAAEEKKDLFSIFALALTDINSDDDPFEPKPIFEGNRCA